MVTIFKSFMTIVLLLAVSSYAWAAHPLITDDAGTQGKGKFQLEVNGQYDSDKEIDAGATVRTTGGQMGGTLSYGVIDSVDIVLGVPYQRTRVSIDGMVDSGEHGISDTTLELKWRFYEKSGASFALKPGVSLPTGNDEKGLGSGKVGYGAFFISSWEANLWELHMNLGYRRNENTVDVDEVKDIWHASVAVTYKVVDDLKAVVNIGVERNPDKASDQDPAFVLGGIIYSVNENFDVDFGVKTALNRAETDYSLLAGTAFKF
jgi:hypothetical protein